MRISNRSSNGWTWVAAACLTVMAAAPLWGQSDWPMYGLNASSTRFSALHQIDHANVGRLKLAWTAHLEQLAPKTAPTAATAAPVPARGAAPAGEAGRGRGRGRGGLTFVRGSEATPIMVNDVLYLPSPYGQVLALVPETGQEIWHYDLPDHATPTLRGVSYWPGDGSHPAEIVFSSGSDLMALNARTGVPITTFGAGGKLNLIEGIENGFPPTGRLSLSSPPYIYKDLVITGARINEGLALGFSADTRAWDASTGKLVWEFHDVPQPGEVGNDTWGDNSWKQRSGSGVWGFMSVDPKLGLVYLPVSNPGYNFYGADRPGANLFSNSIVALNVNTGKLVWYYQMIHHGIWDYDTDSAPVLFDVKHGGTTIPALATVNKVGEVFILDRRDGKPIYGTKEVKVPPTDVPGAKPWPTEPEPILPAPLGIHSFNASQIAKVTPEQEKVCTDLWNADGGAHNDGPFTPFGLKPTVIFPGTIGESNWYGMSYDPQLGYLIVNTTDLGDIGKLVAQPAGSIPAYRRVGYGRFWNPSNDWPCQAPPWGQLTAINVNTGAFAWQVPFGTIPALDKAGVHDTGAPNFGGTITTAGGLIFAAATNDHIFRAIDAATGKTVWSTELPAGAYVTPMTYMGKDGKQYVALIATGGSYYDKTHGDSVVAFALP